MTPAQKVKIEAEVASMKKNLEITQLDIIKTLARSKKTIFNRSKESEETLRKVASMKITAEVLSRNINLLSSI